MRWGASLEKRSKNGKSDSTPSTNSKDIWMMPDTPQFSTLLVGYMFLRTKATT
jgi:hypothetical protein